MPDNSMALYNLQVFGCFLFGFFFFFLVLVNSNDGT